MLQHKHYTSMRICVDPNIIAVLCVFILHICEHSLCVMPYQSCERKTN